MKNFEQLYSEIESKYKNKLKSLKKKALIMRYITLLVILFILVIISIVLIKLKGGLAYPIIMFCAFFSIPLYYIIDYVVVEFKKRKNPNYKQALVLYEEFYCNNIVNDFIEKKYNLKFEFSKYFNYDILNQSKIVMNIDSINQRYRLYGDLKLLNEDNDTEIFVLSTSKYTGTNTDTDAGSLTLKNAIIAICKTPIFDGINLEIDNITRSSVFVKKSCNITLLYNIEGYLLSLKRKISVTIKDSKIFICLHNCDNLNFFLESEKKSLKELCNYLDLVKDIILIFKENI